MEKKYVGGTLIPERFAQQYADAKQRVKNMDKLDGRCVCDPGTIMAALSCGIAECDSDFSYPNADALFDAYVMLENARKIEHGIPVE